MRTEHIWTIEKWKRNPAFNDSARKSGLRLRVETGVDPHVRCAVLAFARWIRTEYRFPVRVCVYIKAARRIRARDGELVCGTCWQPGDHRLSPFIRIAAGDYTELRERYGAFQAVGEILLSMAHELTHYFQWLNGLSLTAIGEERQATNYSWFIFQDYQDARKSEILRFLSTGPDTAQQL